MDHRIGFRELSPEERRLANASRLPPALGVLPAALGRFLLMFLLAFMALMAFAGIVTGIENKSHWDFQPPGWMEPLLIVVLWGPVFVVPSWFAVRSYRRRHREGMVHLRDAQGQVQVLELRNARVVTLVDADERTLHLFALGMQTLVVNGARLETRPELFGLSSIDDYLDELEMGDDEEADLPESPELPFPTSHFELHRLPNSGRLLTLQASGERTPPERVLLSNEMVPAAQASLRDAWEADTWLLDQPLPMLVAVEMR